MSRVRPALSLSGSVWLCWLSVSGLNRYSEDSVAPSGNVELTRNRIALGALIGVFCSSWGPRLPQNAQVGAPESTLQFTTVWLYIPRYVKLYLSLPVLFSPYLMKC
ncbi:hypothetical protein F5X98DRAFT_352401 [Xylaria grammica]|nr:hypothetical protein F5X98DRAFT_352401 [Xylaria grammica]